jgi:DNA-binding response OmpR family regulator
MVGTARKGARLCPPYGALTNPRILIVEDEAALGVMLRYNLEAAQYAVDTIVRAMRPEIRIAEDQPDLIILEFLMERPGRVFSRAHLLDAI